MTSLEEYQSVFTEHQCFVQNIAIQMLGSSYNLKRSNGYRAWLSQQADRLPTSKETITVEEQIQPIEPKTAESKPIITVKKPKNIRLKPIHKKILTFLSETFDVEAIALEGVTNSGILSLPTNGGVYWITNKTSVLFIGTTSDLRKNVMLAVKSIRKKTTDEVLVESINKLINDKIGIIAKTMCIVFLECDETKTRIRIKNRFKNEPQFTPSLE